MRHVVPVLSLLLVSSASTAQQPVNARCSTTVIDAAVEDVIARCSCCHGFGPCARPVLRQAIAADRLPPQCAVRVRHAAAAVCRRVRPACRTAGDDFRWRRTCGDPVCRVGDEPPNGPPCAPDAVPEAPCPTPGAACDPGPSCNALLVCSVNQLAIACPISRRAAKDDIDYLDDAAARRVHDALVRYPLATWRYKTALDDARHLGFIIDDVAPSPAVAPDGAHVDL